MHLAALEKNHKARKSDMPAVATSMLVLFAKQLFSSLKFAYAQFPCIPILLVHKCMTLCGRL